ncbi:hypothetical protein [Rhizobium phaseoli]|uniref:hypothetical protein n=1 Tax=Rhizobium phaseoli TaxID=396 RepID=UPI0002EFE723|nr:hypothetical protein [Rhizobium phaseoli]KKZ86588.1 hypothetical protein RPHASCH2410_CH15790 [Rhizobium phaseoli Ch24-10]
MSLDPTENGAYFHSDVDHVVRLAKLIGRRLSFPVEVMPGEGVADLLFRALSLNGHTSAWLFYELIGITTWLAPTPGALAGKALDCELLADVFGLASSQSLVPLLHESTDRAGTRVDFFGRDIRKKNFFESYRRVSPRSLRKSNYQKAIWSIQGISFDPCTGEQLLTRCPVCGNVLSFIETYGVEKCATCIRRDRVMTDFRDYPRELISVDDEEALKLATDLVNPEVSVVDIDHRLIHDELRRFGPGQLFELISNLAYFKNYCLYGSGRKQPAAGRLTLPLPQDLAEAARAIIDWPSGFALYSERLRQLYHPRQVNQSEPSKFPPTHPIRNASGMLDRDLKKMVNSVACSGRDDAALKTLSEATWDGNASQSPGGITKEIWSLGRTRFGAPGIEAAVRAIQQKKLVLSSDDKSFLILASSAWLRKFCKRTMLPICFVGGVIDSNLLEAIDPRLDSLLGRPDVPPSVALETRLSLVALTDPYPRGAIPLYLAISALATRDVNPWPTVIAAILEGELRVWAHRKAVSFTYYLIADFEKLRDLLSRAQGSVALAALPADKRAVQSVLGLTKLTVESVQRRKILNEDLTLADLWAFRELHISSTEMATRMSMAGQQSYLPAVTSYLTASGVPSIGTHKKGRVVVFWRRDEVERLDGLIMAPRVSDAHVLS